MEIRLGRMRGDLVAAAGFRNIAYGPLIGQVFQLGTPRTAYTWDCQGRQGRPDPRRPSIRPSIALMFALADSRGRLDEFETEEMQEDILDLAGLDNTRALVGALNTALPPPRFQIDYGELADPYMEDYSFRITAAVQYLQCIYRPRALMTGDHFFVFIPHLATFSTLVTGRCSGHLADGTTLSGWSPHVVLDPSLANLESEVQRDQEESRRRAMEQLSEHFREPPPPGHFDPDDPNNPFNDDEEDNEFDEDEDQDEGAEEEVTKNNQRRKKKRG